METDFLLPRSSHHSSYEGNCNSGYGAWDPAPSGQTFSPDQHYDKVDSAPSSAGPSSCQASDSAAEDIMRENRTNRTDMQLSTQELPIKSGKSTISFHGITYEVKQKLDDVPLCGKTGMKEILKDVSGLLTPGLNAIMGPTGSGKTSLLDILSKRKDPRGLKSGRVLLDGEKPPSNFRLMSGYVVQDDVVMGTLTVRENLAFSANLRLPTKHFDQKQRNDKVSQVIKQLGLQDCADSKVGNEFIRGISGGERKRVNIGMELILDPPIIFLDEPTTGLDANTANSIVLLLYRLAKEGRNIILSIHQPRYSIFSLFDRLILLRLGKIVYRGPASRAVHHFKEIGYECPQYHNPADFFLDILGGDIVTAQLLGRMLSTEVPSYESQLEDRLEGVNRVSNDSVDDFLGVRVDTLDESEDDDEGKKLEGGFERSSIAQEEEMILEAILQTYEKKKSFEDVSVTESVSETEYPNGFLHQLSIVSGRTVRNILRNPMTSFAQLILMVFFGVFMGLLYFQLDLKPTGIQDRAGCFFFLIMMQVMSNLSALELFIKQRVHFIHESASGYYRVSAYFISLIFADLVPNRVIPNICFGSIIYFMIGFQLDPGKFFFFILTLIVTAIAASSLAFLVSASVRVFALANILVAVPYLLMMMFGGFLANTTNLLDWLEWIKWVSIFRYGINALTVNEMSGLVFIANSSFPGFDPDSENPCWTDAFPPQRIPQCTTGEEYMTLQGIPYGTAWDLWLNIVALAAIGIGFLMMSFIQLLRIEKYK